MSALSVSQEGTCGHGNAVHQALCFHFPISRVMPVYYRSEAKLSRQNSSPDTPLLLEDGDLLDDGDG